jgi:hypothetical protein
MTVFYIKSIIELSNLNDVHATFSYCKRIVLLSAYIFLFRNAVLLQTLAHLTFQINNIFHEIIGHFKMIVLDSSGLS